MTNLTFRAPSVPALTFLSMRTSPAVRESDRAKDSSDRAKATRGLAVDFAALRAAGAVVREHFREVAAHLVAQMSERGERQRAGASPRYHAGMPVDVTLACTCGDVAGMARGVTRANARRLVCMCDDCQVYALYLRRADTILDAHGGTELSYATQSRVSISRGRERLRAIRLSAGGMLRVYTECCMTPVAHVPSARLAFVAIPHLFMRHGAGASSRDEVLGPVVHKLQGRYGRGAVPDGTHPGTPRGFWLKVMMRVLWDSACARQTPSPFHDAATHTCSVASTVLSAADLASLRDLLGAARNGSVLSVYRR